MKDPIEVLYKLGEKRQEVSLPEELSSLNGNRHNVIVDRPIQRPGQPELLREQRLGGPEAGQDIRLSVSISVLDRMIEAARSSTTRRAVLHQAGVIVRTWRDGNTNHIYQTLELVGRGPVPEENLLVRSFVDSSINL